MKIYTDLKNIGIKVDFNWNNLWGEELDNKIKRAKIVLNLHFYEEPILETSRLTYLLSNNAFVISERSIDLVLDRYYEHLVVFAEYDHIVETCIKYLLSHKGDRVIYADQAYLSFKSKLYSAVIPINVLEPYTKATVEEGNNATIGESNKTDENMPKYINAEIEETDEGQILKLPEISFNDLPTVSILTLTYNRSEIFEIVLRNFRLIEYPIDKLEWIIVDDSNDYHSLIVSKKVAGNPKIKYIKLDRHFSISEKRNFGVSQASGEIIVHMDDDDYYPPSSVLARVKLLLKYKEVGGECVGCCQIGIYNLIENYSYLMATPYPSEASMAYFKTFWTERNFPHQDVPEGEGIPFVHKRTEHVINMPYMFNLIAITHKKNITGKFRTTKVEEGEQFTNFFNLWDFDTQLFFLGVMSKIHREEQRILNN